MSASQYFTTDAVVLVVAAIVYYIGFYHGGKPYAKKYVEKVTPSKEGTDKKA